jgi:nucleotide-binding universal stress UspA family protein
VPDRPRSYLVVVDDTPESRLALRFAAKRAARNAGQVSILNVIPPTDFIQWGGVQDVIEAEAQEKAEALLAEVADAVLAETGIRPSIHVRSGKPVEEVRAAMDADPDLHLLVLGAASKGAPGPLVDFFSGESAGELPCPVLIVPGGLDEAALERLA